MKSFFLLPTDGCVLFDPSATIALQNFPGGDAVANLAPFDAGYGGDQLHYGIFGDSEVATMRRLASASSRVPRLISLRASTA